MYRRYEVIEHDATYHVSFTWIVDVPQDRQSDPDTFRMLRKKGDPAYPGDYAHMDSPTVKKSKQRKAIEQAVLTLLSGGPDSTKNGQGWLKVKPMGTVTRKVSERKKRSTRPLYPIGAETKGGAFAINFILDDDKAPVRYQVEIPLDAFENADRWVYKVYRRTNPRGKDLPNYDLLVMSQGRKRKTDIYSPEELFDIDDRLNSVLYVIDSKDAVAVRMVEVLRRRLHNASADCDLENPSGNETVQMRLKAFAQAISGQLFAAMRDPSDANKARWQALINAMNQNRDSLGPKFEAHLDSIKAKAILAQESAKVAKATQAPYNGFTPPMPTLPWDSGQTAPNATVTPANGTIQGIGALTAFLGVAEEPKAAQPNPAQQSYAERERAVREFLDSVPKD